MLLLRSSPGAAEVRDDRRFSVLGPQSLPTPRPPTSKQVPHSTHSTTQVCEAWVERMTREMVSIEKLPKNMLQVPSAPARWPSAQPLSPLHTLTASNLYRSSGPTATLLHAHITHTLAPPILALLRANQHIKLKRGTLTPSHLTPSDPHTLRPSQSWSNDQPFTTPPHPTPIYPHPTPPPLLPVVVQRPDLLHQVSHTLSRTPQCLQWWSNDQTFFNEVVQQSKLVKARRSPRPPQRPDQRNAAAPPLVPVATPTKLKATRPRPQNAPTPSHPRRSIDWRPNNNTKSKTPSIAP